MAIKSKPRIGLAFSGGGLRGLSYLGVLQVLEEEKVSIDMMAGTSMGGMVAGLYAAGVSLDKLIEFGSKVGLMSVASRDRTWRGLFGHDKMAKLLTDLVEDDNITFEQLRIPIAVAAVDIESGELVVLDKGPLIPALMATGSVPFIFAPVYHQGRWLIDGGILNNFPVDLVRRMGADRVLGLSVPAAIEFASPEKDHERGLSSRRLWFSNNHIRDWKQPFLIAEMSSALTIRLITCTRLELSPPDMLLEIRLPNVGLFVTNGNSEVIEAGYQIAARHRAALAGLWRKPLPPRWRTRLGCTVRRMRRAWTALCEPDYPLFPDGCGEWKNGRRRP